VCNDVNHERMAGCTGHINTVMLMLFRRTSVNLHKPFLSLYKGKKPESTISAKVACFCFLAKR
jgi:hypothetical protein